MTKAEIHELLLDVLSAMLDNEVSKVWKKDSCPHGTPLEKKIAN